MPKIKNKSISLFTALLIAIFSFSGFAFALTAVTGSPMLALVSQAHNGEDDSEDENEDEDEDEDENEDEDEDENDEEDKIEKEKEKKAKEEAKKKAEYQREQWKKKSELLRKQAESRREFEDDDSDEDEEQDEDEQEHEEDDKKADILEDINEDIIEAEERITRAQAEGIDVTKAMATLATAKEKASTAEQALATTSYDTLRSIAREVKKLAHFASHKDVKNSRDMEKDVSKIAKRIAQTRGKITLYASLGGDPGSFNTSLEALEGEFTTLKENLLKGGQDQINALGALEPLERKVKRLKSSIESASYALGGTDERYDDDYENEVEDIYDELNDVAEIEGDELGEQIRTVALAQKSSIDKVSGPVKSIDQRNRVLQFLLGTKGSEIEKLETEITANKARMEVLTEAANKIEDAEVKAIVLDQINELEIETTKLETFVGGQKDRLSAFGWFFKLF